MSACLTTMYRGARSRSCSGSSLASRILSISSHSLTRCGGPVTNSEFERVSGMIRSVVALFMSPSRPDMFITLRPIDEMPLVRSPNIPPLLADDADETELVGKMRSRMAAVSVASEDCR